MKTLNFFKKSVLTLILLTGLTAFTQPPEGINYQAVVRDNNGALIKNQTIDVRFTVLEDSSTNVYQEEQTLTTNAYGLFSTVIGQGNVNNGSFGNIAWEDFEQFVKVEVDAGSGYTKMGVSKFQSVPYALNALNAGNAHWESSGSGEIFYSDTLSSTAGASKVSIDNTNDLNNGQNLLRLETTESSSDFQFIKFETEGFYFDPITGLPTYYTNDVASIEGDGTGNFKDAKLDTLGDQQAPEANHVYGDNAAMAWGFIQAFSGTPEITTDFGIKTVSKNGTGDYTIVLNNQWYGKPAIVITPVETGGVENSTVSSVGTDDNTFDVEILDGSSNPVDSNFMIIVFGRGQ